MIQEGVSELPENVQDIVSLRKLSQRKSLVPLCDEHVAGSEQTTHGKEEMTVRGVEGRGSRSSSLLSPASKWLLERLCPAHPWSKGHDEAWGQSARTPAKGEHRK